MNNLFRLVLSFILGFGWLFLTPAYSDDPLSLAAQEIQKLNESVTELNYKIEFKSLIDIAESQYDDAVNARADRDDASNAYDTAVIVESIALNEKNLAQSAVDGQTAIVDLKLEEKNNAYDAWQIAQVNLETAQSQYPVVGQPGLNAFLYDCWTYNNYYNNAPELGCIQGRGAGIPAAMGPWSSIYFNFGSGGPAGLWDDYQIKWTGYIKSTQHWTPQFRTCGDDGMILMINENPVINDWVDRGGSCGLPVGYYMNSNEWVPIEVWWYENGGGANGQLQWNIGNGWQIVPSSVLSTEIPVISPQVIAAQEAETEAENNYIIKSEEYDSEVLTFQTLQSNLTQANQNLTLADQNLTSAQTEKNNSILVYDQSIVDLNKAIDDAWKYYKEQLDREIAIAIAQALANISQPTQEPEPTPEPEPSPSIEPSPETEPTEEPSSNPNPSPEPSPEQTEPVDPNPEPSSDTTDEPKPEPTVDPETTPEPSPKPSPQPTDIDLEPTPEPEPTPVEPSEEPSNNNTTEDLSNVIANLTSKDNKLVILTPEQVEAVANVLIELSPSQKVDVAKDLGIRVEEITLIAEAMKDNPALATAVVEFSSRLEENANAPMPYTLADATTEIQTELLLSDPIGALTNIDLEKVLNPSEWGKDMTDDQREKAQEVIVPVIIASNIVAAAMTRRIV